MAKVRAVFGPPPKTLAALNGREPHPCWIYPARQEDSSITYGYFCFDRNRRVDRILYGVHL